MKNHQKALVLGGATGFVGRALVETLAASGWDIISTTRKDIDFSQADAAQKLEFLLDSAMPDYVFNAVGYTRVEDAEENYDEALLLNRTMPAQVGRIVREKGLRMVHFSTDFVFNGRKGAPYKTDDPTEPLSAYGATKQAGEEALLALDWDGCLIIRTAWLFGPGGSNFVSTILNRCRDQGSLNVVHDQTGSPTYTLDLAQYTVKLVEAGVSGLFHVVNSGQATWCELADEAVRLAQLECQINPVTSDAYPQKAVRPVFSVLDTKKFVNATGITPRPWPQALRDYIFREFPPE